MIRKEYCETTQTGPVELSWADRFVDYILELRPLVQFLLVCGISLACVVFLICLAYLKAAS